LYFIRSSSLLKSMYAGGGGDTLIVGVLVDGPRSVRVHGFAVRSSGEKSKAFVDGALIKATKTTMAVEVSRRFMVLW
jgi:hypothetical protein